MINSDKTIDVENIKIECSLLDSTLRLVHLSDVHIPRSEVSLSVIVDTVITKKPDIIFITGDFFDSRCTLSEVDQINSFLLQLNSIGRVFWVRGNHELKNRHSKEIVEKLAIKPIINEYVQVQKDIEILGVDETARYVRSHSKSDQLTLVLCHHPEAYSYHLDSSFTYQFSGHVHGGQIRLGSQGLFGPDQGVLLKYSKGYYPMNSNCGLLVNAGLGRSKFPMRINNPSHIVVVDFEPVGYNKKSEGSI